MLLNIGIVSKNFANKIKNKHEYLLKSKFFMKNKRISPTSWNRMKFVYVFPFTIVIRNTKFLKLINKLALYNQFFTSSNFSYLLRYFSNYQGTLHKNGIKLDFFRKNKLKNLIGFPLFNLKKDFLHQNFQNINSFSKMIDYTLNRLMLVKLIKLPVFSDSVRRTHQEEQEELYPRKLEHLKQDYVFVTSQIIVKEKIEKVIDKEENLRKQVQPLPIDVKHLSEQIFQSFERRVRIEKERRGLLC